MDPSILLDNVPRPLFEDWSRLLSPNEVAALSEKFLSPALSGVAQPRSLIALVHSAIHAGRNPTIGQLIHALDESGFGHVVAEIQMLLPHRLVLKSNFNLAIASQDLSAVRSFLRSQLNFPLNEMTNYADNPLSCDGWSGNAFPLCLAAHIGNYKIVDLLLVYGANPDFTCSKHGSFAGRLSTSAVSAEDKQRILDRVAQVSPSAGVLKATSPYPTLNCAIASSDVAAVTEVLQQSPNFR